MTSAKAYSTEMGKMLMREKLSGERDLSEIAVLCDFDGTITTIDTAEFVLARFAEGNFQRFNRLFEKGEIALEECLNKQFSLVKVSKRKIIGELDKRVIFRPNFRELAVTCKQKDTPLVIVSAGLDFVIEHFLKVNDCLDLVEVYSPNAKFSHDGISFTFPELCDQSSINFKQDIVRHGKNQGKFVIFVGDGLADLPAAKDADTVFAIKGSRLSKLCKKTGVECKEMMDFREVIDAVPRINTHVDKR